MICCGAFDILGVGLTPLAVVDADVILTVLSWHQCRTEMVVNGKSLNSHSGRSGTALSVAALEVIHEFEGVDFGCMSKIAETSLLQTKALLQLRSYPWCSLRYSYRILAFLFL